MTSSKELKRGKWSHAELATVRQLCAVMSPEDIGAKIHRSAAFVEKMIEDHNLMSTEAGLEKKLENEIRAALYVKKYWPSLEKQFTPDELKKFESIWINLMIQFNQDVKFSEEMQMKEYATMEILKDRHMEESLQAKRAVDEKRKAIEKELRLPVDQRDTMLIGALQTEINFLETGVKGSEKTHQAWIKDVIAAREKLNANRNTRTNNIEDFKQSWTGNLRLLESPNYREKTGQTIAVLAIAAEAARMKLAEYHVYNDGVIDQPFLNCDTVKDDTDEIKQTRKTEEDN